MDTRVLVNLFVEGIILDGHKTLDIFFGHTEKKGVNKEKVYIFLNNI
jgi:hypothetical protein